MARVEELARSPGIPPLAVQAKSIDDGLRDVASISANIIPSIDLIVDLLAATAFAETYS